MRRPRRSAGDEEQGLPAEGVVFCPSQPLSESHQSREPWKGTMDSLPSSTSSSPLAEPDHKEGPGVGSWRLWTSPARRGKKGPSGLGPKELAPEERVQIMSLWIRPGSWGSEAGTGSGLGDFSVLSCLIALSPLCLLLCLSKSYPFFKAQLRSCGLCQKFPGGPFHYCALILLPMPVIIFILII